MGSVITTTLQSGATLVITPTFDTGELLIAKLLLAVLALVVFEFVFKVVYR